MNFREGQIINLEVNCNTSGRPEIICLDKETYKLKINTKPLKGKANKEIISFFKDQGYRIEIVRGLRSSKKIIKIVSLC